MKFRMFEETILVLKVKNEELRKELSNKPEIKSNVDIFKNENDMLKAQIQVLKNELEINKKEFTQKLQQKEIPKFKNFQDDKNKFDVDNKTQEIQRCLKNSLDLQIYFYSTYFLYLFSL